MKKLKLISFLLVEFISLVAISAFAQTKIRVTGNVTEQDGMPIIGAMVVQKGTTNAVITDINGKFLISNVPEGAILEIRYLGFKTMEVTASKKELNVVLQEDVTQLDKSIVIGYGTVKKRDMTGAVISVSGSEIENKMPTDIFEALQGQTPGVQIVTNSGAPGEGASVRVRGIATFGEGASPLYVVDGFPVEDADLINPNDILSIEILKDAASAAIYGSRSANGVILITTKKGSPGRSRMQAKYQYSANAIANCIDLTTPDQFRYFDKVRQGMGEVGASTYTDPYNRFQNSPYNILDYIFRTASKHQVDLSASGGKDETKYYVGLGFLTEDGVIVGSDFTKATMRLNLEYQAAPKIKVGHKLFTSYSYRNGLYSESSVLTQLYDWVPFWNIFLADGELMHNIENRNSALTYALKGVNKNQRVNTSVQNYAEIDILKGLKLTTNLSASFYANRTQTYKPTELLGTVATDKTTGIDYAYYSYTALNENYFNYSFKTDNHELSAVLGQSYQFWNTDYVRVTGQDYTTDELYTLNFASSIKASETLSTINQHSLLSFFARLNYTLKNKYLLAFNIREDASSRFGTNKKWGMFPSGSAGWRFSEETFMNWCSTFLHEGKLRASFGVTGNDAIGDYDSYLIYSPGNYYEGVSGIAPSRLGNPDLGWERTQQTNVGLDLSLLNNKISVSGDYYIKTTSDLLYRCQLPKETGFSTITRNVGSMMNNGFELNMSANILSKNRWKWDVNFNISHNNAVITGLADGIPFYTGTNNAIYVQENARVGEFYGYKHDGIFQYDESNAFTEDWQQLTPIFSNGVFTNSYQLNGKPYSGTVYRKAYSDGVVLKGGDVNWLEAENAKNGIIDTDDRVLLGCAQPDFYGGLNTTFSYRNLSIYVAFYYSMGGEIYNHGRKSRNSFQRTYTSPEPNVINNMWTKPGDVSIYPRPVSTYEYNRLGPSDFWIEDASYIKLRNVKLSYKFPRKWIKKINMKDISAYFYGNNLLTWTAYQGFDPEFSGSSALSFGIDHNRYPRKREFGFGLNLTF